MMAASKEGKTAKYLRVLGLTETADKDEIKKAYKELALQQHPDKNPGDKDATAKFQELSQAYTYLNRDEDFASDDEYDEADDDYDEYYEDDIDLIDLLRFFQFLRRGSGEDYQPRCSCCPHGVPRARPGARIIRTPFGLIVDSDSDTDDEQLPGRKQYSDRYQQRSSEGYVPNRSSSSQTSTTSYYSTDGMGKKRRNKKKKNKNGNSSNVTKSDNQQKSQVSQESMQPKKKSKKEMIMEQKKRQKEMEEIAADLEKKQREDEERVKKRQEKEKQRREELTKSTVSPPTQRIRKKSLEEKVIDQEVVSQLQRSHKEQFVQEQLIQNSKQDATKRMKGKKRREEKQKRRKGQVEDLSTATECADDKSELAEFDMTAPKSASFSDDPDWARLNTTTKQVHVKPKGHKNSWHPPAKPDVILSDMGNNASTGQKPIKVVHTSDGTMLISKSKTDVRPKQQEKSYYTNGHQEKPYRFNNQQQEKPFRSNSQQQQQQHGSGSWVGANVPPRFQKKQQHQQRQQRQEEENWDAPSNPSKVSSGPVRNVWDERQTFVKSAMPSNSMEEEEMLQAALKLSELQAQEEELRRKFEEEALQIAESESQRQTPEDTVMHEPSHSMDSIIPANLSMQASPEATALFTHSKPPGAFISRKPDHTAFPPSSSRDEQPVAYNEPISRPVKRTTVSINNASSVPSSPAVSRQKGAVASGDAYDSLDEIDDCDVEYKERNDSFHAPVVRSEEEMCNVAPSVPSWDLPPQNPMPDISIQPQVFPSLQEPVFSDSSVFKEVNNNDEGKRGIGGEGVSLRSATEDPSLDDDWEGPKEQPPTIYPSRGFVEPQKPVGRKLGRGRSFTTNMTDRAPPGKKSEPHTPSSRPAVIGGFRKKQAVPSHPQSESPPVSLHDAAPPLATRPPGMNSTSAFVHQPYHGFGSSPAATILPQPAFHPPPAKSESWEDELDDVPVDGLSIREQTEPKASPVGTVLPTPQQPTPASKPQSQAMPSLSELTAFYTMANPYSANQGNAMPFLPIMTAMAPRPSGPGGEGGGGGGGGPVYAAPMPMLANMVPVFGMPAGYPNPFMQPMPAIFPQNKPGQAASNMSPPPCSLPDGMHG